METVPWGTMTDAIWYKRHVFFRPKCQAPVWQQLCWWVLMQHFFWLFMAEKKLHAFFSAIIYSWYHSATFGIVAWFCPVCVNLHHKQPIF